MVDCKGKKSAKISLYSLQLFHGLQFLHAKSLQLFRTTETIADFLVEMVWNLLAVIILELVVELALAHSENAGCFSLVASAFVQCEQDGLFYYSLDRFAERHRK
jgi:hypothetical protein